MLRPFWPIQLWYFPCDQETFCAAADFSSPTKRLFVSPLAVNQKYMQYQTECVVKTSTNELEQYTLNPHTTTTKMQVCELAAVKLSISGHYYYCISMFSFSLHCQELKKCIEQYSVERHK